VIERLNEEHGIVDLTRCVRKPVIGERIRIVPNHVCVVTNLHDEGRGLPSRRRGRNLADPGRGERRDDGLGRDAGGYRPPARGRRPADLVPCRPDLFYQGSTRFDTTGGPRSPLPFSDDNAVALGQNSVSAGLWCRHPASVFQLLARASTA